MKRIVQSRPLGVAFAIAALVLAFSVGGATAAGVITGRQIKNHSIGLVDLTKKAQKALRARVGPRGPQGPAGPVGPPGPAGQAGTVAYARVSRTGGVIAASSKNVAAANVVRTAVGQYCVRGLPAGIRSAVASPSGGRAIGAVIGPMTVNCSFVISTFAANGARVDNSFYVQFA
jgi:hypothetical protein